MPNKVCLASTKKSQLNQYPLISAIALRFDHSGAFVMQALGSVRCQTYHNIQLIIFDDCSSDHSVQLIREWSESFIDTL